MAGKTGQDSAPYYVFYYDARHKVELSARLPESKTHTKSGRPIKLQIRAALPDPTGTPRTAYFNLYHRKGDKTPYFEADDPIEIVETRTFIDRNTGKISEEVTIHAPGTARDTARREQRELGDFVERPIQKGERISLHGAPKRPSRSADGDQRATIQQILGTLQNFSPGLRNAVIGRTHRALKARDNSGEKEISRIRDEDVPTNRKFRHQANERFARATRAHTPKVCVRLRDHRYELLSYENYQAQFSTAKFSRPKQKTDEIDEETQAIIDKHQQPVPRLSGSKAPQASMKMKINKAKSLAPLQCDDALYVLIEGDNGLPKRVEAPHISLPPSTKTMRESGLSSKEINHLQASLPKPFEVWLLDNPYQKETPHFLVIERSDKGRIEHAARFRITRRESDHTITAELWPYNDTKHKHNPLTHPSHNMFRTSAPYPLESAQAIAEMLAADALSVWYQCAPEEIASRQHNFLGAPTPGTRITHQEHKGPLAEHIIAAKLHRVA